MASGRILRRFGDVYGSVVNLASRLTSIARPGTILVDKELAADLENEPAFELRSRRPVSVRGYNRLRPSALRRARDRH
jgi:adenylate cyclase